MDIGGQARPTRRRGLTRKGRREGRPCGRGRSRSCGRSCPWLGMLELREARAREARGGRGRVKQQVFQVEPGRRELVGTVRRNPPESSQTPRVAQAGSSRRSKGVRDKRRLDWVVVPGRGLSLTRLSLVRHAAPSSLQRSFHHRSQRQIASTSYVSTSVSLPSSSPPPPRLPTHHPPPPSPSSPPPSPGSTAPGPSIREGSPSRQRPFAAWRSLASDTR